MPSTNGSSTVPKGAILYARVSTDEQARSGFSLAQQIEALRAYAAREGYEILEEVEDPGQSGASLERPGMDRVRDLVAGEPRVSVVLAQDRDRFSREPAYTYLLKREFEERGTALRSLNDSSGDGPEAELTDGILDQLAKFERAKIAERSRRGKLRKAREGKIVASTRPDYGFEYNDARDNYVVVEEEMRLVRRIFQMIGVDGATLHGVTRAFEREGLPSPNGKRYWSTYFIRSCILDDVYKAHTYDEVEALVSPEVVARLSPEKHYGIWWFNTVRSTTSQIAESGPDGRRYRRHRKRTAKPREDWIAVPVPDPGIPREWADAAREAIARNKRASKNGGRFWELSGGILRCADCGCTMKTTTVRAGSSEKRNHYYVCAKRDQNREACDHRKSHRFDDLEPRVWDAVSAILRDPEQLRADLEAMIELERGAVRGDPEKEARAWLDQLAEADTERRGYLRLAAQGRITDAELEEALVRLGETCAEAESELASLQSRQDAVEVLERDKEALLDHYAQLAPEALDSLDAGERHLLYKMLKLDVTVDKEGTMVLHGAFGEDLSVSQNERIQSRSSPAW